MESNRRQKALARLRRIEGQIRGIHRMVEDDRYCVEVLTQTSAVIAALHGVEDLILENHLDTCVADAMRSGDSDLGSEKISEVMAVVSKFRSHG